jgi:hypothetical protein
MPAPAIKLQSVRINLEPRPTRGIAQHILQPVTAELRHLTTAGTDHVVMVLAGVILGQLIHCATIVQHDLADDLQVSHQLHRPKDRRPTNIRSGQLHILRCEVVAKLAHRVQHRATWRRQPVTTSGQRALNRICNSHNSMVQTGIVRCQTASIPA